MGHIPGLALLGVLAAFGVAYAAAARSDGVVQMITQLAPTHFRWVLKIRR